MLAERPNPKPDRRLEHDEPRERHEDDRDPDHQVQVPEDLAEERHVVEEREPDVRDARDVGRRALLPVDVDEQVAGEADREEVDRRPADDLVRPEVDRPERVDERHRAAGRDPDEQPEPPRVELVGAHDPEERAHQHHPLEADVHDAGPLGEHARRARRRPAASRSGASREQRRPDDDALELPDPRARREVGEAEAEQRRRRSRTPRSAARPRDRDADAEHDRDQGEARGSEPTSGS